MCNSIRIIFGHRCLLFCSNFVLKRNAFAVASKRMGNTKLLEQILWKCRRINFVHSVWPQQSNANQLRFVWCQWKRSVYPAVLVWLGHSFRFLSLSSLNGSNCIAHFWTCSYNRKVTPSQSKLATWLAEEYIVCMEFNYNSIRYTFMRSHMNVIDSCWIKQI